MHNCLNVLGAYHDLTPFGPIPNALTIRICTLPASTLGNPQQPVAEPPNRAAKFRTLIHGG